MKYTTIGTSWSNRAEIDKCTELLLLQTTVKASFLFGPICFVANFEVYSLLTVILSENEKRVDTGHRRTTGEKKVRRKYEKAHCTTVLFPFVRFSLFLFGCSFLKFHTTRPRIV